MDINYELYKVFYYVATTLSFSEASKKLYISQSAVSQSIKALEGKLSQTLFIRSTKKVQPDSGRRDSAPSHRTGHQPDPAAANHSFWNPSLPVDRSELQPVTQYVGIFWCHILNGFIRHSRICISKSSMQHLSAVSIS